MLEGIKVVEMASIAAGPAAAAMMAEWGADVIKIEPIEGDRGRHTLPGLGVHNLEINPDVDLHNRGKRSIALQLNNPESHEIILKLIEKTDVFLTNMQPHKLEQRKLDWPDLSAVNPRLIYASITGYGRKGPHRELPGIDHAAFWARSGMVNLITPKGQEPVPIRMAMGDRVTAMALLSGILAAYIEMLKTGRGKIVEASLLRTGIFTVGTDIALQTVRGRVGSNKPRHDNVNPYHSFFPTKDDRWMAVNFGMAKNLGDALGHPELNDDPRFIDAPTRRKHNKEIVDIFDKIFKERTLAEWYQRFEEKADFVWAPVNTPGDVLEDPQAQAAGAFVDIPRKDGKGTYRGPAMPVGFFNDDGSPDGLPKTQAPDLGEQTDEILKSIGYSDDYILELRDKTIVA